MLYAVGNCKIGVDNPQHPALAGEFTMDNAYHEQIWNENTPKHGQAFRSRRNLPAAAVSPEGRCADDVSLEDPMWPPSPEIVNRFPRGWQLRVSGSPTSMTIEG